MKCIFVIHVFHKGLVVLLKIGGKDNQIFKKKKKSAPQNYPKANMHSMINNHQINVVRYHYIPYEMAKIFRLTLSGIDVRVETYMLLVGV